MALRRALALAALAVAFLACAYLLLIAPGQGYRVTVLFEDAGQLVTGNEVQVGGVAVGKVASIELREDERVAAVELEIDEDMAPLHQGTTAAIRNPSLTSIAGRYVSLLPGPNDAPRIDDGGEIAGEDSHEIVDLDQLLNSLDPKTVAALSQVVRGSTAAARGRGDELGEAFEMLDPAASRAAVTLGEVASDQRSLERLVVSASDVVSTLADRRDDISEGTAAAASALNAIATERDALASTLSGAPATLRRAEPALGSLRVLLEDVEPAIGEARPVARGLSRLLPKLRPVSTRLRGVLPRARRVIRTRGANNDLTELLRELPALGGHGVPLAEDLTAVTEQARPILAEVRPYIPELTSGIVAGFGGSSGGYYDANGHYARISFLGGPFSIAGLAPLFPPAGTLIQGAGDRCPGGAAYAATDGSNPFVEPGVECDPSLVAAGP